MSFFCDVFIVKVLSLCLSDMTLYRQKRPSINLFYFYYVETKSSNRIRRDTISQTVHSTRNHFIKKTIECYHVINNCVVTFTKKNPSKIF